MRRVGDCVGVVTRIVLLAGLLLVIGAAVACIATPVAAPTAQRPTTLVPPSQRVGTPTRPPVVATALPTRLPSPSLTPEGLLFDGRLAYEHALAQCALGPRPTGSAAGRATGDYIIQTLQSYGWRVETQDFDYEGVPVRNIIGRQGRGEVAPVGIIGAHYDTRRVADQDPIDPTQPVPGGNDGASGVAVLLELARVWSGATLPMDVWLAVFDAEDNGHLDGWPWSVGARHMAEDLQVTPAWVIVVDMVGDADQQFYYERNSDPALMERLWAIAADLGYAEHFIPRYKWAITDDHIPFVQRGIPAVDIIDFDYPYWHTVQDTCDKVSPESLERVGRVVQRFVEGGGQVIRR